MTMNEEESELERARRRAPATNQTLLWQGKSAHLAIELFQALTAANLDGVQIVKVRTSGSPDFKVYADVFGDEAMEQHAREIVKGLVR
jgi:hypothetical protein